MMGGVLLVGGLALDGTDTAKITLGQQAIGWQWIALTGAVLFIAFSAWTQISIYRAFSDHSKYRRVVVDLAPFVYRGNLLLDIHCRPESPSPLGEDVNKWLVEVAMYLYKHYPEGAAYFDNDNIDYYDKSTPVACRQIRGRLERLNEISRELRSLAGGMALSPRQ